MEQAAIEQPGGHIDPPEADRFNNTAKAGWVWFTKFLLWNVIACIAALLLIGVFTVWS